VATHSPKTPARRPEKATKARPARRGSRADRSDAHQGATEEQVGERAGSGAGYDLDPVKEKTRGGVES
jgi:hypothetical protein